MNRLTNNSLNDYKRAKAIKTLKSGNVPITEANIEIMLSAMKDKSNEKHESQMRYIEKWTKEIVNRKGKQSAR